MTVVRSTFCFRYVLECTSQHGCLGCVSRVAWDSREMALDVIEEITGMGWEWRVTTVVRAV